MVWLHFPPGWLDDKTLTLLLLRVKNISIPHKLCFIDVVALKYFKNKCREGYERTFAISDGQINKEGSDRQIRGEGQGFKKNVGSTMLPIYKSKLTVTIDK